jgi:hypothetical protein
MLPEPSSLPSPKRLVDEWQKQPIRGADLADSVVAVRIDAGGWK